ncbi:hypothetical protein FOM02_39700 [Bradyrhizobium sp. SEMIA]|uniref:Uncharacterized protein n=1 Tax=Bradyrhizobium arachidis TaxID=858423 RepID=A0AAE7NXG7_9BRAD|nr:hypothetical protein FOM02_39700 [Bradyrhizobium sp. SEMIA]QOZ73617.1 hypothetical protein WN72_28445 [Bradyrhizobium arachidis]
MGVKFLRGMDSGWGRVTKPGRKRARAASRAPTRTRNEEPGEGGADEAVAFISEQAGALRKLAERHKLDVLHYLLGMTKLEADEHLRLRSKRKLS